MKNKKTNTNKYQCKMFTNEEMTGSGQLNLLHLIDRINNENKYKKP